MGKDIDKMTLPKKLIDQKAQLNFATNKYF